MRGKLASVVAVLILSACGGGGGGGGGNQLSLSLTPNPLKASYYPGQLPATLTVNATTTGNVSSSTVYVLVTDPGNTFETASIGITNNGGGSFSASLPTASNLSVGAHSNTLQIQLCGDPNCQNQLVSSNLPYDITIQPPLVNSITPSPFEISAMQGSAASFQINVTGAGSAFYASVSDPSGNFSSAPFALTLPAGSLPSSGTSQTYVGLAPLAAGISATQHTGNLMLNLCADSACNDSYESIPLPYQLQVLSLVAGQAGTTGLTNGQGAAATFSGPISIALDPSNNVLVSDKGNNVIRLVTPSGMVSTAYTPTGEYPVNFGFNVDQSGNIYYGSNSGVAKVTPSGEVSSLPVYLQATAIASDAAGNVYAVGLRDSSGIFYLYKITPSGSATQYPPGATFGSVAEALAADSAGNVFVGGEQLSEVSATNQSITSIPNTIHDYLSIAVDSNENLFIANLGNTVYEINSAGTQSMAVPPGAVLSNGAALTPQSVAIAPGGLLYISDVNNSVIVSTTLP